MLIAKAYSRVVLASRRGRLQGAILRASGMSFPMHRADHVHKNSIRMFSMISEIRSETEANRFPDPILIREEVPIWNYHE